MIPYGRQDINQADIDAVISVLRSDFLTQGPVVPAFEKAVSNYCGAQHSVAVNSATSALHIACLALGVGKGDSVWTTPVTFVASANCALYCGATVDFVDIDPRTYNLSVDCLAEKLALAEKTGNLPKVVIPVHLCGQPCNMAGIHKLSQQYGFKIIEDASHAIGGKYKNEPIGNCRYSDITIFSFHPVKIITTGEGGMAVTNDATVHSQMLRLRSHGITREPKEMTNASDGPWFYQQIDLGYNYRMTDIQAALGLSQMRRLDEFVAKRHDLAAHYVKLLENLPVTVPFQHADSYSGLHLFVIRLPYDKDKLNRREVFERLRTHGIGVNLHYIPIYRQPYYERMGYTSNDFPESELYYAEAITLPMYPSLTNVQQQEIVQVLNSFIGHQTIFKATEKLI
jgi:UDP-4-amino-4,6-dideoxy-N-acetyl-beta-L-altrosamine transaminase